MRLIFPILLLLQIFAVPVSAQVPCNFDSLLDSYTFFQNNTSSKKVYENESDTGWRKSYTIKGMNNTASIFIGHSFSPDIREMTEIEYLNYFDLEISKVQSMYLNNGFESERKFSIKSKPFYWEVYANTIYNGRSFYEKYSNIQVGNMCNFLILERYPSYFVNSDNYSMFKEQLSEVQDVAYGYHGPVSINPGKYVPENLTAVLTGLIIPLLIAVASYYILHTNSIYSEASFYTSQRIFITIMPIIAGFYLLSSIVIDIFDNNNYVGYEISALCALFVVGYMAWGVVGRNVHFPISLHVSSFIVALLYISFDWKYVDLPYYIFLLVSVLSIGQIIFMSKMAIETRKIKGQRNIYGT